MPSREPIGGGVEGFEIYGSTLKAADLVCSCAFDRWSPENPLARAREGASERW
jgi:hypothetical protein